MQRVCVIYPTACALRVVLSMAASCVFVCMLVWLWTYVVVTYMCVGALSACLTDHVHVCAILFTNRASGCS